VVVGCLWPPAALGQGTPDFTWAPDPPVAGEPVTFTPSETPPGATISWQYGPDYDPDGAFVPDATHSFAEPGSYAVTMRVEESGLPADDHTKTVTVRPLASFDRDPSYSVVLTTGQVAKFTSTSAPWSGESLSSLKWDIDGDGLFDDGSGAVLNQAFGTSGNQIVRLEVVQSNGEHDIATSIFRVNAPPVPGFVWTPGSPVAGNDVQLYSTSVDAEGALADQDQAWDLDDDGQFDDATGPAVTGTFSTGDHDVSLRVTDSDNVSRTITRTITVAAPVVIPQGPAPVAPTTPTPSTTPAAPSLMKPFPIVRLVGVLTAGGARITLLEVRNGPVGAKVTVRCIGDDCPFKSRRRILEDGRVRLSKIGALPAGTRLQVLVRAPGVIGRFVGFRIRKGKRPLRADRCLMPGASEPTRCT
jgi:PKD domain